MARTRAYTKIADPKKTELPSEPAAAGSAAKKKIVIDKVTFEFAKILLRSTAPMCQNRFSSENRTKMEEKQKEGSSKGKTRRAKPAKDFEKVYRGSMHISKAGWHGIPASSFRQAMIDACRLTEFDMTRAKMCIKVIADGYDKEDGQPLIKITKGEPRMAVEPVRIGMNQTDLASRAVFDEWEAIVTVQWDASVFTATDIFNLLERAGWGIGVGAGRPFSKNSGGMGRGTFEIVKKKGTQ